MHETSLAPSDAPAENPAGEPRRASQVRPGTRAASRNATTLLALGLEIARKYRRILIGAAIGAFAGLLLGLLVPRRFSSQVSFVPESKGTALPQASMLPFGLSLGGDNRSSPRFYVELLGSQAVSDMVLRAPVRTVAGQATRPLLDVLAPEPAAVAKREDIARRKLHKMVSTRIQPEPGIVYVSVSAASPQEAADVGNALVAAVERFDVEMRQTEAKDRRAFLENRAADARIALDGAERAMQSFLEANRLLNAPRLIYEQGRLQRDIELKQGLYLTLANQLETARIDEVNQRPRISVIDSATVPVRADSRMIPMYVLSGLVIGAAVALAPLLLGRSLRP
jgi:uncharacterized protein involved in exopolysaccharide biosynthesis